jgi:hypothetical protein
MVQSRLRRSPTTEPPSQTARTNRNKSDLGAKRTASFANAASGHGGCFPSYLEIVMIPRSVAVGLMESLCEEET